MATLIIAPRPATIDGCFQNWSETDASTTVRSDMDMGGYTKIRRRTTVAAWQVNASVTLPADLYDDFMNWFRVDCGAGIFPTRVKTPLGKEVVMRFSQPPAIEWPEAEPNAFRVTVSLEQMPAWKDL